MRAVMMIGKKFSDFNFLLFVARVNLQVEV